VLLGFCPCAPSLLCCDLHLSAIEWLQGPQAQLDWALVLVQVRLLEHIHTVTKGAQHISQACNHSGPVSVHQQTVTQQHDSLRLQYHHACFFTRYQITCRSISCSHMLHEFCALLQEYANGGSLLTELQSGWMRQVDTGTVDLNLVLQVSTRKPQLHCLMHYTAAASLCTLPYQCSSCLLPDTATYPLCTLP
jgi:hypothetical protein